MTFQTELGLRLITSLLISGVIGMTFLINVPFPGLVVLGVYVLVWFALGPVFHN